MPYFSFLDDDANVMSVLAHNKERFLPFEQSLNHLMRGPSDLSVEERELVAAYVSGLNACGFCYGAHAAVAESFGFDAGLIESMVADLDTSDVAPKLKALLSYCRQLTVEPSKVTEAHVTSAIDAGWSENAVHDAAAVTAFFAFMNRMVDGHGVQALSKEGNQAVGSFLGAAGYDVLKGM